MYDVSPWILTRYSVVKYPATLVHECHCVFSARLWACVLLCHMLFFGLLSPLLKYQEGKLTFVCVV